MWLGPSLRPRARISLQFLLFLMLIIRADQAGRKWVRAGPPNGAQHRLPRLPPAVHAWPASNRRLSVSP